MKQVAADPESRKTAALERARAYELTIRGLAEAALEEAPSEAPAYADEIEQIGRMANRRSLEGASRVSTLARVTAMRLRCRAASGRRSASRGPRRPRRAPTKAATRDGGDSGDDGPPAPGPLVHQGNSGLPRRGFLEIVRQLKVPHRWVGRLCVVRADHLYRALGLADASPAAVAPAPAWTPDVLLRAIRGGK
jgi:hypothetical protein